MKRILLFLSDLKPGASEALYACPNGEVFIGTQTNEAPVQYLLHQNPDTSQILCIVTKRARETAWEKFLETVKKVSPKVEVTDIPFRDGEDIAQDPLLAIQAQVQGDDELFLDITGGPRNAVLDLLLLSRALSYSGAKTVGAVYTDFQEKKIVDISQTIGLFDLVGGMQELTSCGSVRSLRAYYGSKPKDPTVGKLLTAMEGLTESLTLCRTTKLDRQMEAFNAAMDTVEDTSDPMLRALLPKFQESFGDRRLTTPGIIKWCAENGMVQQALTLYKERIPVFLLKQPKGLLKVKENAPQPQMKKDYASEEEARFYEQFLKMGQRITVAQKGWDSAIRNGKTRDYTVMTLENLGEYLRSGKCYFECRCSIEQMEQIARDYLYLRLLRNMVNHASEEIGDSQEELLEYLRDAGHYPDPETLRIGDIQKRIQEALNNLKV